MQIPSREIVGYNICFGWFRVWGNDCKKYVESYQTTFPEVIKKVKEIEYGNNQVNEDDELTNAIRLSREEAEQEEAELIRQVQEYENNQVNEDDELTNAIRLSREEAEQEAAELIRQVQEYENNQVNEDDELTNAIRLSREEAEQEAAELIRQVQEYEFNENLKDFIGSSYLFTNYKTATRLTNDLVRILLVVRLLKMKVILKLLLH